jgi:hypothetical protein
MKFHFSLTRLLPTIAAGLLFVGCVDLTPVWNKRKDAAIATIDGAGGAGPADDGGIPGGIDAAGGAGGTMGTEKKDGAGGTIALDAMPVADASTDVPYVADAQTTTDSTGPVDATDAADAPVAGDSGLDVPYAVDTRLSVDQGTDRQPLDVYDSGTDRTAAETTGMDAGATGDTEADSAMDAGKTDGAGTDGTTASMIISIDFVGGRPSDDAGVTGTVAMAASESAGVKPATHWNSAAGATGTLAALTLETGNATEASFSWNGSNIKTWTLGSTDAPGNVRMMNGYLDPLATSAPLTIQVAGLPAPMSSGYDVYVYCYGDVPEGDTRNYQYKIGSTTYSVKQPGPSAMTFSGFTLASEADAGAPAGNYVVFRNLTGDTFTLIALPGTSGWAVERAPVNGIQIVYPSGS